MLVAGPHFLLLSQGGNFWRGTEASLWQAQCGRRGGSGVAGQRGDHRALARMRKQGFLREALLEERARSVVGCGPGAWLPAAPTPCA